VYTIFYVKVIVIVLSITHVSKATMLMYAFFVMLFQYCILISKYLNFNGVFLNKTSFLVYCRLSPVVVCYTPNAFRPQMHSGTSKRVWGSQIPKCIWFRPKCISGRSEMHLGNYLPATNRRGCSKFSVAAALPAAIVSDELAANEISM
jgi:hypothetical protein